MIVSVRTAPRDGGRADLVDAIAACHGMSERMAAVDDMIRKFPGTDGRRLLWVAVAGVPTERDRTALIRALRK